MRPPFSPDSGGKRSAQKIEKHGSAAPAGFEALSFKKDCYKNHDMRSLKALSGLLVLTLALYWLYPRKSGAPSTGNGVPASDQIEINYLGPASAIDRTAAQAAIDEFERRNPRYRVRLAVNITQDMQADPTRFLIGVAGGAPPDVIFFDRFAVSEWAARGAFLPLDPFLEKDGKAGVPQTIRAADFYAPAWDEATYQGRVYGIPNNMDTRVLFYNKDLLVRAGLVDASGEAMPPRTWEELEDYALRLTERDDRGNISLLGFAPNYGNSYLTIYAWMNGGEFLSEDGRQVTFLDPKVVGALDWISRLYEKLGGFAQVDAFQRGFQEGALDPFITGKVAMKIDGQWQMARLAAYGQNLNFACAPPPMPAERLAEGVAPVTWMGGWVYAIPSTARQKEAAWELIRWLSSEEANIIVGDRMQRIEAAKGRLYMPRQHPNIAINQMLYDRYVAPTTLRDDFKAGYRLFNDLIPGARYRPRTPVGQYLWRAQLEATEAALYQAATPFDALATGQEQVQRRLDQFYEEIPGPLVDWRWFFAGYLVLIVFVVWALPWIDRRVTDSHSQPGRGETRAAYLFVSPWLLGFVTITAGAMLFSFVLSFCQYDLINPARWTGWENYRLLFTRDELFWQSLGNTFFMLLGVPLGMALSLAIAMLLVTEVRGVALWRTFFYLPSIVPLVASSLLWVWIFNPQGGLLNAMLDVVGISGPNWLGSAETSKWSLILMGLWTAGGGMVIWIAGLKGIPESYYEAAAIDGANAWSRFLHITIPMLTPYIFFNLIMGLIGTFKIFEVAYIMTGGGPANSTTFYVYHLFNQAFKYLNMGQASAMAWILFAVIAALTIFQIKMSKRWVHYEQD